MKKEQSQITLVSIIILLTAIVRILNAEAHFYNLVPIAALGLFSGSILSNKKWAYIIPLAAMLLSDLGLAAFTKTPGFYGISQVVNYSALVIVTLLGTSLKNRNALNILGYTIGSSLIFFVLSNFGTFLQGYYGYHVSGLISCYAMAIPFYKSELATTFFLHSFIGDVCFSALAFSIVSFVGSKEFKIRIA